MRYRRFPHTRGDGPVGVARNPMGPKFSPHAWGWTVGDEGETRQGRVFPTRVGMDRRGCYQSFIVRGFPHTRGDGPKMAELEKLFGLFSPHAWGWTVGHPSRRRSVPVFPTRVGLDLRG